MTSKREQEALIDQDLVVVSPVTTTVFHQVIDERGNQGETAAATAVDGATQRQIRGAAVAGCLTGTLIGGPVLGLLGAGTAAIAASSNDTSAGHFCRACGDATADAGDRIQDFEAEHHLGAKLSSVVGKACTWMGKKLTS